MVVDNTIDLIPSQIEDFLFLGSYDAACSLENLEKLKITHILNCGFGLINQFPNVGFKHKK